MEGGKKQILILGGGFGGVYTAMFLEKILSPEETSISLVNQENYWVNQPMLPEVISASIGITDVVSPIRLLCPRTHLVMRRVESIDLKNRVVTLSPGFRPRLLQVSYDYLVIALGSITDFTGMPGMLEHAMPFRTLSEALALRNHLIHALEEADVESDPEFRAKLLTFVVAGGGFSGVEAVAELNDFVHRTRHNYLHLRDELVRVVLVHSGDRILPEMDEALALFAQKLLTRRGVELILKDRLAAATSEKAILKSGKEIPCKTIVSTVPSAIAPVLQALECAKERNRLLVDGNLELKGYEGQVWALGDCAAIKTKSGQPVPPTAQHATREAKTVATNIAAVMRGGNRTVFAFEGLGKMGSLGHYSAVADILGLKVSGFLAWILWRMIYLMKVPGFNRKLRIALDWVVALLFQPDLVQVRFFRGSGMMHQHFEPGEVIFNQGDIGDNVYVIEKGECDVLKEEGGRQLLLATLRKGDYFGEMAVLADVSRNATVKARTAMDVVLIKKQDFNLLKAGVPAFGQVFQDLAHRRAAAGSQNPSDEKAQP
jgi:NADH:quinone reductase (non-electrogenic)